MKYIFLGIVALGMHMHLYAQNAHYYIDGGRNEVGTVVKNLPDGSSIIAGYIHDTDPNTGEITNADNLCFRIAASGTILWQQQWGTNGDDILHDMIISSNNEIVCAGTADRTALYTGNNAALYKLDINTGTILNQYFMRRTPVSTYPAGDVYFSVCETANGDFLAVGSANYRPYFSDGLISLIDGSTFTGVYDINMPFDTQHSDFFTSVVADGNTVYMTGIETDVSGPSWFDQIVVAFDPYGSPIGNVVWQQSYDFSYTVAGSTVLSSNYPFKIQHDNNKLIISGGLYGNWTGTNGDRQYLFTCDMATGGPNPEVRIVNNGLPSNLYNNYSSMLVINSDEVYVSNVPATTGYLYNTPSTQVGFDVWMSHINMLSNPIPNVVKSVSFQLTENEVVRSMHLAQGYPSLTGYIIAAGNAQPLGRNDFDLYFSQIHPLLPRGEDPCIVDETTTADHTPVASTSVSANIGSITNNPSISIATEIVSLNVMLECGTSHWKKGTDVNEMSDITTSFVVAPNPARSLFNVHYGIPSSFNDAHITVTDVTGKVIVPAQPVTQASGIVAVQLPVGLATGTYMCYMYVDGKVSATKKLLVE